MVTRTGTAASKVKQLMNGQSEADSGLRVAVRGGGCSGFQYALAFDQLAQGPADFLRVLDVLELDLVLGLVGRVQDEAADAKQLLAEGLAHLDVEDAVEQRFVGDGAQQADAADQAILVDGVAGE